MLSTVCFFATDIHSASLGRDKQDDSLKRVRDGDLSGKGEVVVRQLDMLRTSEQLTSLDDIRETGRTVSTESCHPQLSKFQDTHVPREGRDLIRKSLEDANVTCSVG